MLKFTKNVAGACNRNNEGYARPRVPGPAAAAYAHEKAGPKPDFFMLLYVGLLAALGRSFCLGIRKITSLEDRDLIRCQEFLHSGVDLLRR